MPFRSAIAFCGSVSWNEDSGPLDEVQHGPLFGSILMLLHRLLPNRQRGQRSHGMIHLQPEGDSSTTYYFVLYSRYVDWWDGSRTASCA